MPKAAGETPGLTERQKKWFASVQAGLARDTGRTIDDWVAVARTCPHTAAKARATWLREQHGLGANRAAYVLSVAFPSADAGWNDPEGLRAALWKDPVSAATLTRLEAAIGALPDTVCGQRKSFTAWSRRVQFAAARPLRGGHAILGLAIDPATDSRLSPRGRSESWGDRLKGQMVLTGPQDVDADLASLLRAAWEHA